VKLVAIRNTTEIYFELGLRPSTTWLRRRSADVTSVFLHGYRAAAIAHALCVDVALIEDSIRWEMKRRDKNRKAVRRG
jgi:5'-deoxynucleotidase YfbR-like HD superfamily hydrolase